MVHSAVYYPVNFQFAVNNFQLTRGYSLIIHWLSAINQ